MNSNQYIQSGKNAIKEIARASAHGISSGTIRLAQGGKFEHGFISGFASSLSGSIISFSRNPLINIAITSTIGGTSEVLGGGKFVNGAITASYTYLFNHYLHDNPPKGAASGQGGNNPIEYVGAINDIALAGAMGYNALDNGLKRKYAYQLSKHINAKPGNIYQSAKSFGKSSAKVLGKTASVIAVGSIAYDFGTGTANTATLVDAGMLIGGAATVAILGTVAAPFVVGAGVVYGVGCLFGFDAYLNETLDISKNINFINNK